MSNASSPEVHTPLVPSGFSDFDRPDYADYARCVHCGLCLNHCPTYRLWGREADSPRGRTRQIALVDEGRIPLAGDFVEHIDRCLDCRACETACPSGVEYRKIVELARAQIDQNYKRPLGSSIVRDLVYRRLLPYPNRIGAAARVLRMYQRSGVARLARASGILRLLGLEEREKLLPLIDSDFFFSELGTTYPSVGPRRARVAFVAGCIAQVTFAELNRATIRVLQANGCEVVMPAAQGCCGALPSHSGMRDVARDLARTNIAAFSPTDFDAILTNAAGCGSTLKEYSHLFPASDPSCDAAVELSAKMADVTEFLVGLGISAPLGRIPLRVTYQDSCHLLHGQKIREAPRALIRLVPGVELVEMPHADQCCGSAGVYNVTQTKTSLDLLAQKMTWVGETGVQAIVTANPGCIIQLRAGAALHNTGHEVLHIVELLDRSIRSASA